LIELIFALLLGIGLLLFSSDKTIEFTQKLAKIIGIPPLLIGIIILAMGTSLPEIMTSITSSAAGHGDINVGDVLGSCLSQITLILGLSVLLGGEVRGARKDVMLLGGCAILAAILAVFVAEKGFITRTNAIFLIGSYFIFLFISERYTRKRYFVPPENVSHDRKELLQLLFKILIGLLFVLGSSWVVVNSIVEISVMIGIPEYFVSFFGLALGTSLPELAICLAAIRKKNFELVIGNILGSNMTDATLALGSGPLIAPNFLQEGAFVLTTGIYMVFASAIVVGLFAFRRKIDKKAGLALIALYILSYLFVGLAIHLT